VNTLLKDGTIGIGWIQHQLLLGLKDVTLSLTSHGCGPQENNCNSDAILAETEGTGQMQLIV